MIVNVYLVTGRLNKKVCSVKFKTFFSTLTTINIPY